MKKLTQKGSNTSEEIESKREMIGVNGMVISNPILTGFLFLLMIQNIQPELANLTPCPDSYPHLIGYLDILVVRSLDIII